MVIVAMLKAKDILNLIPDSLFKELSATTSVDYKVKKLNGRVLFSLLLYSLLSQKDTSLRVLEQVFNSFKFKSIVGIDRHETVRFSSISERITNVDFKYFKAIFEHCVSLYIASITKPSNVVRFDSTLVSLSSKILHIGFRSGGQQEQVRQLKFTVAYSDIPEIANFYHTPTFNSENIALLDTIMDHKTLDGQTIVVDAGLQSRNAYDKITDNGKVFITRITPKYRHELEKEHGLPQKGGGVKIIRDHSVWLFNRQHQKSKHSYRIVHALVKNESKELAFLTNNRELSAHQIADIYRKRWDIEVFFKFLKQELNLKHLINRSENGVQVVLYTIMTLSVLLQIYRINNKLGGKIAKLRFTFELEEELIKHIVILSGGDPSKMNPREHFF